MADPTGKKKMDMDTDADGPKVKPSGDSVSQVPHLLNTPILCKPPPGEVYWPKELAEDQFIGITTKVIQNWETFDSKDVKDWIPLDTWTNQRPSALTIFSNLDTNIGIGSRSGSSLAKQSLEFAKMNKKHVETLIKCSFFEIVACLNRLRNVDGTTAVFVTGSAISGTYIPGSDLDITLLSTLDVDVIIAMLEKYLNLKKISKNPLKSFLLALKFVSGVSVDIAINNIDAIRSSYLLNSISNRVDSFTELLLIMKTFGQRNGWKKGLKSYAIALLLIFALQTAKRIPCFFLHGQDGCLSQNTNLFRISQFGAENILGPCHLDPADGIAAVLEVFLYQHDFETDVIQITSPAKLGKVAPRKSMNIREPFHGGEVMKPLTEESNELFLKYFLASLWKAKKSFESYRSIGNFLTSCNYAETDSLYAEYMGERNKAGKAKKSKSH